MIRHDVEMGAALSSTRDTRPRWSRRFAHAARSWSAVAPVLLLLAGCGASQQPAAVLKQLGAVSSDPKYPSAFCEGGSHRLHGKLKPYQDCVFTYSDGQRFRCPILLGLRPPPRDVIERESPCEQAHPVTIPNHDKPVVAQLQRVRACLKTRRLPVSGRLDLPDLDLGIPFTLVGQLRTGKPPGSMVIDFYQSTAATNAALSWTVHHVKTRDGIVVAHHADTLVVWLRQSSSEPLRLAKQCLPKLE